MDEIESFNSKVYIEWLNKLQVTIEMSRVLASRKANREALKLNWLIGDEIIRRQEEHGWGSMVIDKLSNDLKVLFPASTGFSRRNLQYMRQFAAEWRLEEIMSPESSALTWTHHIRLLDKIQLPDIRKFYMKEAAESGWSVNLMTHQIDTELFQRTGNTKNNFSLTISDPARSLAANNLFKDPYLIEFIDAGNITHERQLENALIAKVRDLLLELGKGFAYYGNQEKLKVGDDDFYLDLLFYNTKLHCFVVIDLKMGEFKPEFAGKMNFYLAAVDAQLKGDSDYPSIGLILCKGKNGLVVEYTLQGMSSPMAVADYRVLPPQVAAVLPSPEEIENGLRLHSIPEMQVGDYNENGEPDNDELPKP